MRTYGYLYGKMLKNRIRKLFSKPASVIYVIFFTAYFGWLAYMLNGVMMEGSFGTKENLVRILAMITIYFTPANYVSYARRAMPEEKDCFFFRETYIFSLVPRQVPR